MAMKRQPEGIRRCARSATVGEDGKRAAAAEYDIWWRSEPGAKEVLLGYTQRAPGGKWRAFPAQGGEWPREWPDHTAAVQHLLVTHRGWEVTSEGGSAVEAAQTEATLADPDTMAAIAEGEAGPSAAEPAPEPDGQAPPGLLLPVFRPPQQPDAQPAEPWEYPAPGPRPSPSVLDETFWSPVHDQGPAS